MKKKIDVERETLKVKNLLFTDSFGQYSANSNNEKSKEENTIFIDKINSELYDIMSKNKFLRISSSIEVFKKLQLNYESDSVVIMTKTKQLEAFDNYCGYNIKKVNKTSFNDFLTFYEKVQIYFSATNSIYNIVDDSILEFCDAYNIYHDEKVIGQFFIYGDNIIEDVFIDEDYRHKGIMKNYINLVFNNKECYLRCDEDVVEFYKKCGFEVLYKYTEHRHVIDDYEVLLKKVKQLL